MTEDDFIKDFKALLKKYNADFELGDDGRPYGMHLPVAHISWYDMKNNHGIIVKLPSWMDGDTP